MKLNYKQFGQGEPIIILHGLFGTLDNWQTIAKKLAENYMVFIIDQRNHGKSPHSDAFSYKILAEDLKAFMLEQHMYEATIIGHSMGGKVAMRFALDYPDMVTKLVVVDIAPKQYSGGHQVIFDAMFGLDLEKLTDRQSIDEALKASIPEDSIRLFLMKNLARQKDGGYRWKMNLPVLYKEYQEILSAIEAEDAYDDEVLFIRGGRSRYIKDEDVLEIQEIFPLMRLETISNAGHWLHAEAPKMFIKIVKDFI